MSDILYHAVTISGRRANNEDSFAPKVVGRMYRPLARGIHLFAVSDGMGGAAAGEVASHLAIDVLFSCVRDSLSTERVHPMTELRELLSDGFIEAQREMATKIADNPTLSGMGCTLTALLISESKYVWGNIGDSRIYLLTENNAVLLTKDHTLLQEYTEKSGNPPDAEWIKNYSHYLTRAVDGGEGLPDMFPIGKVWEDLPAEYCFVICSDGLFTDKSQDILQIMTRIIKGSPSIKHAAEQLVAYAFYEGSTDNITVSLICSPGFPFSGSKDKSWKPLTFPPVEDRKKPFGKKRRSKIFKGIILAFLALASVISGIIVISDEFSHPITVNDSYILKEDKNIDKIDRLSAPKNGFSGRWSPFEDFPLSDVGMDTLLNRNSKIFFKPYSGPGRVLNYSISIVMNHDTIETFTQSPSKNGQSNSIDLRKFKRITQGSYVLSVEAHLEDGTLLIGDDNFKFGFR